jgi:hypothetical protein
MPKPDSIDRAIAHLDGREAGWVYRRDAAEILGKSAAKAIHALRARENEADVDVKTAVHNALVIARDALEGTGAAGHVGYSLKALAEYMAKPGVREVSRQDDGYAIDVTLKDGRKQRVYMQPFVQRSGRAMVRLYSFCGPAPSGKVRDWALRNNTQFAQCALALMAHEGEERLALVNAFVLEWAAPQAVKASLKEITHYADWLEKKLTGDDIF